jgi:type I restriction enzyme S subunit
MNATKTIVRSVSADEEAAVHARYDLGHPNIRALDWTEQELGNILTLNYGWSLPEKKRIAGDVPVYGSNGVVGTHERALVPSPGLIIGRKGSAGNVHYSHKPFCPIDTTFYVAADDTSLDLKFLYFLLLHIDLKRILGDVGVPGLNREMAYREKAWFPSNPHEQRKIAYVLGLVQQAIEQQERLIVMTSELKKALLQKLFTHGFHGEPQKQTEIGPVPQSWEIVTLENAAVTFDYGTSVKCELGKAGVPVLRIPNVVVGSIDLRELKHGQPKRNELEQLRLQDGDLLFVRTNGVLENAGRCALYRGELEGCYFASYLIRVRVDASKVLPAFVNEYARTDRGRSFLSGRAIRTADGKFNINSGTLKRLMLPLPSVAEQKEIVEELDLVERESNLHQRKHAAFAALFRTLLHQLMTAQIRVQDLDLPELETVTQG